MYCWLLCNQLFYDGHSGCKRLKHGLHAIKQRGVLAGDAFCVADHCEEGFLEVHYVKRNILYAISCIQSVDVATAVGVFLAPFFHTLF